MIIPAPENVRIHWSDGEIEAVDCIYQGVGEDGSHLWRIINRREVEIERRPVGMLIDVFRPGVSLVAEIDEWFRE